MTMIRIFTLNKLTTIIVEVREKNITSGVLKYTSALKVSVPLQSIKIRVLEEIIFITIMSLRTNIILPTPSMYLFKLNSVRRTNRIISKQNLLG